VTLDLGSANITAPKFSPGAGVHVMSSATGTVVMGTTGIPALIQSFTVGIQVDATSVSLENITTKFDAIGFELNGGSGFGAALSALNSSVVGILIDTSGPGPYLTDLTASDTFGPGIELNGVHGAFLANLIATSNNTYGVWLKASSRNVIVNFNASRNTDAGIYLGCFKTGGLLGRACTTSPPTPPSNGNILTSVGDGSSTVDEPSMVGQAYGIAIGAGNLGNRIVGMTGTGNGNGSFGVDAEDGNVNCGTDVWSGNSFGAANPSTCIH
jgi:Periplasmic copper-binding protein (NosD)